MTTRCAPHSKHRLLWLFLSLTLLCFTASCTSDQTGNPLGVHPDLPDLAANPRLASRIADSPHNYFRFINEPFTTLVCDRYAGGVHAFSDVALHGDAHIEQYAITPDGYGLADYDATTNGPAIVDLLRFATSVDIAGMQRNWPDAGREAVRAFIDGYRAALTEPELVASEAGIIARIRANFGDDRTAAFARCERLMSPLSISMDLLQSRLTGYVNQVCETQPGLTRNHFKIKAAGDLRVGIGSALYAKYLLRLEGPTPADEDDLFIEVKEAPDLAGSSCVKTDWKDNAERIMTGETRLSYAPCRYRGCMSLPSRESPDEDQRFCIHLWELAYCAIDIEDDLETESDLVELARNCGVQLGLGHPRMAPEAEQEELRRKLLAALDSCEEDLVANTAELSELTVQAWQDYRNSTNK